MLQDNGLFTPGLSSRTSDNPTSSGRRDLRHYGCDKRTHWRTLHCRRNLHKATYGCCHSQHCSSQDGGKLSDEVLPTCVTVGTGGGGGGLDAATLFLMMIG